MKLVRRLLNHPAALRVLEVFDRRMENRMTEFGMLAQAFEFCKINAIEGDYFEFGVWQGKTFGYARAMARRYGYGPLTFRAFDSFQGLPAVEPGDYEIWQEGQFAFGRSEFERVLSQKGFERSDYQIVEGFYNDSLNQELIESLEKQSVKASIVYIDCDLYESTRDVLAFIGPFLQDGTVICFDDFFNYRGRADMGEQKAFEEYKAQTPFLSFRPYMPYSPLGMSFIVQKQAEPAPQSTAPDSPSS